MPTDEYMARVEAQFEILDELPLWQAELVWEYGVDRTLRALRLYPTPKKARAALEAERRADEFYRWNKDSLLL